MQCSTTFGLKLVTVPSNCLFTFACKFGGVSGGEFGLPWKNMEQRRRTMSDTTMGDFEIIGNAGIESGKMMELAKLLDLRSILQPTLR